jgi:hypothetical protein
MGMAMLYMASLAFQSSKYEPHEENLIALLEALKAVPFEERLEHIYPREE